jgi:hypothetical protein
MNERKEISPKITALENRLTDKHKDIIDILYDFAQSRATICSIIHFKTGRNLHLSSGCTIRSKTDLDDIPFACALAFKRAKKNYLSFLRETEQQHKE